MKDKIKWLYTFLTETGVTIFGMLVGIITAKEKRKTIFAVGMTIFLLVSFGIVYRFMKIRKKEIIQE